MASEVNTPEVRTSAFQSRLSIPECGLLVKCEDSVSVRTSSTKATNFSSPTTNNLRVPLAGNTPSSNNNNNSSPKMGSRRIFTPQFKLQVLESYRSDSDCKGNQRATARKYNIHRRQIQKWLQCESNLRSSVANINQNSVKHQFHNISHHQQHQQHSSQSQITQHMPISIAAPSASLSGTSNGYGHHQHHHPQVPLDTARQTLALNSINVPSMPARVSTSSGGPAQGVLAAANLAAAVAVAIASSSSPNTSTTAVSPLRPTAIGGNSGTAVSNSVATISPSLLHSHHHHHHHHFPLSPYSHSPVAAPVPVSVPMLSHHLAPSSQPHALHQPYSYHNLSSHSHAHSHTLPLSHQSSAFLPTACLPVNVLSAVAVASPPVNATTTIPTTANKAVVDLQESENEENCMNDNANVEAKPFEATHKQGTKTTIGVLDATTTSTPTVVPAIAVLTGSTRNYLLDAGYESMCRVADSESMRDVTCRKFLEQSLYQYVDHNTSNALMASPIDLSCGSRRKTENRDYSEDTLGTSLRPLRVHDMTIDCHHHESSITNKYNPVSAQVVDLTLRKRKVVPSVASVNEIDTEQPQKLAKRLDGSGNDRKIIANASAINDAANQNETNNESSDDDEEVEIEVEVDVEAKLMSSKPVKLFKPYLLDDADNNDSENAKSNGRSLNSPPVLSEQRDPIIWSNHPAFSYDGSRASSIQSPPAGDKNTFHLGSPHFLASKPSSPQSVLSHTSVPSMSPTNFPLRCPKGSPVSGYESSSSICSDRDYTCSLTEHGTYSLDFQMQAVCENKVTSQPSQPIPIPDWLNQDPNTDTNTPPLARASIALYA